MALRAAGQASRQTGVHENSKICVPAQSEAKLNIKKVQVKPPQKMDKIHHIVPSSHGCNILLHTHNRTHIHTHIDSSHQQLQTFPTFIVYKVHII